MILKIVVNFADSGTTVYLTGSKFVIGRKASQFQPDLCLNLDLSVSPKHLRLQHADGNWHLERLPGAGIVQVNGDEIDQPVTLKAGDLIRLGKCVLEWEEVDAIPDDYRHQGNKSIQVKEAPPPAADPLDEVHTEGGSVAQVSATIDARSTDPIEFDITRKDAQPRISNLFDLPNEISHEPNLKELCRITLAKALSVIPGAEKGVFLSFDPKTDTLALRASIPEDNPPISENLIMRAATEATGFIWHYRQGMVNPAIPKNDGTYGMFAPLVWEEQIMGVISVENDSAQNPFIEDDLRYLMAISHYAAAAISNNLLKDDLRQQNQIQERLLANFSKPLRKTLVDKAKEGRLTPGGERSDVTLLLSDLRGYTATSAGMSPEEVVEMLNDYYSELVSVVMDYQGTIDKFIGDAILAVFGSPVPDEHQHVNAMRAASVMLETMKLVNKRRKSEGKKYCEIGIGVHSGEVLHGFIGSEERLEFTVIGDAVNRSARLCDGAGAGTILVSPELREAVGERFKFRPNDLTDKHGVSIPAFRLDTF